MIDKIFNLIDGQQRSLLSLADFIYDHPELGEREFQAAEQLCCYLEGQGFKVEKGIVGVSTAFLATTVIGCGGPIIGLLCEYDALDGLGHACGHHLQGPTMVGAAAALAKFCADEHLDLTIRVYGTPAEETTSAKLPMVEAGLFDDLDVALMMHAGDRTTVDTKSLAMNLIDFIYTGKAAHAAVAPDQGRSALDGVLMLFNGIEYLREHVKSDVRMHGVITDGGKAANIVPERAAAQFYIRAANRPYLNGVVERVYEVAKGAAQITGTQVEICEGKGYDNKFNVQTLNDLLFKYASLVGAPNITPPRSETGSTDFSSVTYRVPGACLRMAFTKQGTSSHSQEWLDAGKSPEAHQAVIISAKAIAAACADLVVHPELLHAVKDDFRMEKEKAQLARA